MISAAASTAAPTGLATLLTSLGADRVRVIDLTQTLSPDFPTLVLPPEFGQCAPFRMEQVSRYDASGPAWYWNTISMNEHTGTHFDAPIHWVTGRDLPNNSVDAIPPQQFIAPVCVIDCAAAAAADPDFKLEAAHIEAWEKMHGPVPAGAWFFLRTDWSKRSPSDYVNLREDGAHTPGPSPGAVRYLVDHCDVLGFGVETIGTDCGQAHHFNPPYPAHHYLHGKGKFGLQCMTNLDQLPPTGAIVIAAPLKIKQGSGSPLRVLALVEGKA